jgi:hypothetical protein
MTNNWKKPCFLLLFLTTCVTVQAQNNYRTDTLQPFKIIAANPVYKTSPFHQYLWGRNYRAEWATPVRIPVALLDTMVGGLKPTQAGGGNQTQSLTLETKDKKTYSLRSVNKTLGKVIPKEFHGTFIEDLVNDKVSMSHPYAAGTVPILAEAARIYHTKPTYVYLPKQPALDTFNKKFGNEIYLFEQKVDNDWRDANHLGNFDNYTSTKKLLEKIREDNDNQIDQKRFIKSRLFDMFINDWDRHEDQWEWGKVEKDDVKIYQPIPKDRDQAFFKYDGVLLKMLFGVSGISYMQPMANDLKDVKDFNWEQRNLDRLFSNQMTLADWQNAARELQTEITDNVIDNALKQLPAEIHNISIPPIRAKLISRRDRIDEWANTYYKFIAKEVDIPGSESKEHFSITSDNDQQTTVKIFKINKEGEESSTPFYSRTFTKNETDEIRLYGISGHDKYTVQGGESKIKLRLIGGFEKDSFNITGTRKVQVYDNPGNSIASNGSSRVHISEDTSINSYKYKSFTYDKSGISPVLSFSNEDRLFAGLGYKSLTHKWRREPFASKQSLSANYSISQRAISLTYKGLYPNVIGNWDIDLLGSLDVVRWTNFFGLGNETKFVGGEIDYYRARTTEWMASVGFEQKYANSVLRLSPFFQSVRVLKDTQKFVAKGFSNLYPDVYNTNNFGGLQLIYITNNVNDPVVPTKGISFFGNASYTQNLKEASRYVGNFSGDAFFYIPLISKISLAIRAGAGTVTGAPEFYQYPGIGGGQTMRGFRRDRFRGETAVYNSNELRFINNVKSHLFNGKAGLLVFYDNGRVWMPRENSNTWHSGYGAGILLAPFNKVLADVTYGISNDETLIQLRLSLPIK